MNIEVIQYYFCSKTGSLCAVKNKYYPQTFLHKFFECNSVESNSVKKHNKNSLFTELVQLFDWSDDESNDKA